jgi:hypothetical protein
MADVRIGASTFTARAADRPPELFRIHIRPGGGLADASVSFDYCLREQVLGLGWQVEFPSGSDRTWETYELLAVSSFVRPQPLNRRLTMQYRNKSLDMNTF